MAAVATASTAKLSLLLHFPRQGSRRLRSAKLQRTSASLGAGCLLSLMPPSTSYIIKNILCASSPPIPYNVISSSTLDSSLFVADIDPATAKMAIGFMGPALSAFGFLFILRIIMSWYPKLPVDKFPYVLAYAPTEPFLKVTRKVIPPLAGVDVTPVVWFGLVSFLSEILVGPQGLLVLLSQQT